MWALPSRSDPTWIEPLPALNSTKDVGQDKKRMVSKGSAFGGVEGRSPSPFLPSGSAAGRCRTDVGGFVREVHRGVCGEEAGGFEHEAGVFDGHDGEVLGLAHVRMAEAVPHHDIGVFDVAVGGDVGGEAGAALVLVGVVAGGEAFFRGVGGDPDVFRREAGAVVDGAAFLGKQ